MTYNGPAINELQDYLAELYSARSAILKSKTYSIKGQTVTRADEHWITDQIKETESKLYKKSGGPTSARVVFGRGGR